MKTERKILIAFILNLAFSVFELFGGMLTNSVAIISDAVHDFGDATAIGISLILEKKSKKKADEEHSYGYIGYSMFGGLITSIILLFGSVLVIVNAIERIFDPGEIDYGGMILFAVVGLAVNTLAVFFTRRGESLNQRAVNLHMLEDVLGWAVVLLGAVIMRFADISIIDPLLSIGVTLYISIHAVKNLNQICDVLLMKSPRGIEPERIRCHLMELEGITDVHHLHIWTIDQVNNYATVHVVTDGDQLAAKKAVKKELAELGIAHCTVELESLGEICEDKECRTCAAGVVRHSHHSHNHRHGH